ncbi:MAG: hypothetical protein QM726_11305 [Chitinophagaceae bacterium]
MKPILFITLLIALTGICASAQEDNGKYRFSKEVFEKSYQQKNYQKFNGQIEIKDNTHILYDGQMITLPNDLNEDYKLIFSQGLCYLKLFTPVLIHGEFSIIYFDDLSAINPNPQTKRFIFWMQTSGLINPTEYYLELKNEAATSTTTLKEFITKARLSFFYKGTIII